MNKLEMCVFWRRSSLTHWSELWCPVGHRGSGTPFPSGAEFLAWAMLLDFAPGSLHRKFPWRGKQAGSCCQPHCPGLCLLLCSPPRLLRHAPRGSSQFGAVSIPARGGGYVCRRWQTAEYPYNLFCGAIKPTSMEFQAKPGFLVSRKAGKKGLEKDCRLVAGTICCPCLGPRMFPWCMKKTHVKRDAR